MQSRDLVIRPLLMLLLGAVLAYRQLGDAEKEPEEREEPEPVDAQAPKGRPDLPLGPSHRGPSPSISAGLLDGLKAVDTRSFWWAFAIATPAYLLGIYGDTFGSITEYLTAFAAGAGSMYVANYKLLPWVRSYRPAKSS